MADVTKALLLPDVHIPTDRLLKTLAIYWDQLVLPDYVERAGASEGSSSEFAEASEAFSELESHGVILRQERRAFLPPVDLSDLPAVTRDHARRDDGVARSAAMISPLLKLVESRSEAGARPGELPEIDSAEAKAAGLATIKRFFNYAAEHYMGRTQDALALAGAHNLAPVARSAVSHVASMLGASPGDAPRAEATMLSTAIQAFEIDPDTPIDEVLRFREQNAASLGRLRASLVDLSEGLRQDAKPTQLLAEARDRYRNRVAPALGDLESALAVGRIRFLIRSLMGTTALAVGSIDPIKAAEGSAVLLGQTINYSFSRDKLIQDHPFGYLHQVSNDLSTDKQEEGTQVLESVIDDPESRIREMFIEDLRLGSFEDVMRGLWGFSRPE